MQERPTETMRTWFASILGGEYSKIWPTELYKYIKENNIPYEVPFIEEEEGKIYTSLYFNEDKHIFAEQIYNGGTSKFAIYNTKAKNVVYVDNLEDNTIFPLIGEEIEKKAIMLPTKAEEYGTDEKLEKDLKKFITTWLDVPEDVLQFAIWNIKRSWIFERFHTLNYLRALGDTGLGKTRFLDTLGMLHYKPISISGATTAAPVFRMIEKWRGTLIMDEADFKKSDESQDIIKIINMGYERGKFVMRCEQNDASKINFFDPYCPKILATRKTFYDKAVESRCITHVMTGTMRKEIPVNLNEDFFDDAQTLRNKLLMWRFRNYHKINPKNNIELELGELEPRVRQIVSSFVSLFGNNTKQMIRFKEFIKNYQEELIEERRSSFYGDVVEAIYNLLMKGEINITSYDVIIEGGLTSQKGKEMKPRSLSNILKSLGFGKTTMRKIDVKVKRCIPLDDKHLENLFKRYGFLGNEVTMVTVVRGIEQKNNNNDNKQKKLDSVTVERGHHKDRYDRYTVTEEFVDETWKSIDITFEKCSCGSESVCWERRDSKRFCQDCKQTLEDQK